VADEITQYLAENWDQAQIKLARDRVFAAHISGLNEAVIVTGTSFEGASSSFTVSASPAQRERFLRQCREALNMIAGNSMTPAPGVKLDFSTRYTST